MKIRPHCFIDALRNKGFKVKFIVGGKEDFLSTISSEHYMIEPTGNIYILGFLAMTRIESYHLKQIDKSLTPFHLLGHSDVAATMIYTHVYDSGLANKMRLKKPIDA